jgi:hypothetical protein
MCDVLDCVCAYHVFIHAYTHMDTHTISHTITSFIHTHMEHVTQYKSCTDRDTYTDTLLSHTLSLFLGTCVKWKYHTQCQTVHTHTHTHFLSRTSTCFK